MPAFRVALFDYDGTLAATSPAVAACMSRTLRERGEPVPDATRLSAVIASGVPLAKAFAALAPHLPDDDVDWCVRRYREHYLQADSAHTTRTVERGANSARTRVVRLTVPRMAY